MARSKLIQNQICMNLSVGWDFGSIDWVKWNSIDQTRTELKSRFQKPLVFFSLKVCLDITYFAENWKHYNKIIFKCVNNIVRPSFKVFFVE